MSNSVPDGAEGKTTADVAPVKVRIVGSKVARLVNPIATFIKFVLAEKKEEEEKILTLAESNSGQVEHRYLVPHGANLIGAGEIMRSLGGDVREVDWGSMSCMDEFGYDCPKDTKEADAALVLVRDTYVAWMEAQKEALAQK